MADATRTQSAARAPVEDVATIVENLVETFGPSLLSFILDSDRRSVQRWVAGQAPRYHSEKRIRDMDTVSSLLHQKEEPATIRAWFMGMNPQLDDRSPAEVMRADNARDVMAAARAHLNDA